MKKWIVYIALAVACVILSSIVFSVAGWYSLDLPKPMIIARQIIFALMLYGVTFETYLLIKK